MRSINLLNIYNNGVLDGLDNSTDRYKISDTNNTITVESVYEEFNSGTLAKKCKEIIEDFWLDDFKRNPYIEATYCGQSMVININKKIIGQNGEHKWFLSGSNGNIMELNPAILNKNEKGRRSDLNLSTLLFILELFKIKFRNLSRDKKIKYIKIFKK